MTPWLRTAALWTAGAAAAIAIVAGVYFAALALVHLVRGNEPAPSADFTKSAYDQSGNPITGPVSIGQVIQYVLRYKPPAGGVTSPATITDTLSANQTYVGGSVVAPHWTLSTPVYNANTETYTNVGFGPTGFVLPVPAITGSAGAPGGGGDGYEPVPVLTSTGVKVFGVNHHQAANGLIMCWFGANLAKCEPTYPKRASTSPEQRGTPDFPHAAVFNKKLYFPAGRYDETLKTTLEFGMGCWDAETDAECPFISLPGQPSLNMAGNTVPYLGTNLDGYVAGVRADPLNPSHLLMYANGNVYCVDIAAVGAPACPGWVPSLIVPVSTAGRSSDMFVDESGARVFFSNTKPAVHCLKLSDGTTCTGWPATGVNGGTSVGATHLGPGLNNAGVMNAICLVRTFSAAPNFNCFDFATGANVISWPASLSTSGIFAAYHIRPTGRVLFPPYLNNPVPKCYDFVAAAYCTPFTPYWSSNGNWLDSSGATHGSVRDYGYASDPSAPQDCIYGLGDGGILVRFGMDGSAATGACAPKVYHATFSLDDEFCFHKPTVATWTTVDILNRPGALTGGTITIKDSSGTVIQTIMVGSANSYPLNISALGLNSTVTINFTPAYAGNTPPTTDYQIKLNYTANEDSQICYQATVTACGEVSNTATLKDDLATLSASVNLGTATGGTCGPPPAPDCLILTPSLVANPDGSGTLTLNLGGPPGFTARRVTVTSQTAGVTVAPPTRTFAIGQTQANWALTGLAPGMTVTFKVDAVDVGGGSTPGTDKCCSATVTVTVPPDNVQGKVDLGILKTGEAHVTDHDGPAGTTHSGEYAFNLSVTNVGVPIAGQNAVVVTDTVPAGMMFTNASGSDWNCGPVSQFPIAAGGVLTCSYVGSGVLATGAVLAPITVIGQVLNLTSGYHFQNCANVGTAPASGYVDSNAANDNSCYAHSTGVLTPTVTPEQGCDGGRVRAAGGACRCPDGTSDLPGRDCVPLDTFCTPGAHWNGRSCVTCNDRTKWNPQTKMCSQAPACDRATATQRGDKCVCRFEGMRQSSPTQCGCPPGTSLVPGMGCLKQHAECDMASTISRGDSCVCRYEDMEQTSPNRCRCPQGTELEPGRGCMLVCRDPMIPNQSGTRCVCPEGTEPSNGRCEKKDSVIDGIFNHVHIGGSFGGGQGGRNGKPDSGPVPKGP